MKTLFLTMVTLVLTSCGKAPNAGDFTAFKCGYDATVHADKTFSYVPGTFMRVCAILTLGVDVYKQDSWKGLYWASMNHECGFWTKDGVMLSPNVGDEAHISDTGYEECDTQDSSGQGNVPAYVAPAN